MKGLETLMWNLSAMRAAFAFPLALAVTLTPPVASADPSRAQTMDSATRIDTYVRARMPGLRTPGLSLVVVEGDQVILNRGYGFADREAGTPMTEDTPVAVGSTTKPMTALAVMQLVERGLVDLDTSVMTYLPDFRMADERSAGITLRQLLSHTAGIPAAETYDGAQDDEALERRVHGLADVPLNRAPGSGFEYANDGYSVAGLIVQRVTGMPYEQYMAQAVFAPVGMHRTTFDPSEAASWGWAQGYGKRRGVVAPAPIVLSRGIGPAGMVVTTATDVGQYFVALLNGGEADGTQIIAQASLDEAWTPMVPLGEGPDHYGYGLGWGVGELGGQRILAHSGTVDTAGSYFLLVPDQRIAVGVLANMTGDEKAELAMDVLSMTLGNEPSPRAPALDWRPAASGFTPNPEVWGAYVGDYQSPQGALRVYREQDQLHVSGGGAVFDLVPLSDTAFILLGDDTALDEVAAEFRRDPNGSVGFYLGGARFGLKS
jgi:CubicO group peptidase (beta-lactamase class C family)